VQGERERVIVGNLTCFLHESYSFQKPKAHNSPLPLPLPCKLNIDRCRYARGTRGEGGG